ncbi:MAG: hypothetical protein WC533_04795 [Candidatus Pacearchaeota archaeon]
MNNPNLDRIMEQQEIENLIANTPIAGKVEVEKYHDEIKRRLDSGVIIPVMGNTHRALHLQMWIKAFFIYNSCENHTIGGECFVSGPNCDVVARGCNRIHNCRSKDFLEGLTCENERFDIWYASEYGTKNTAEDAYTRSILARAREEAEYFFGRELEQVRLNI